MSYSEPLSLRSILVRLFFRRPDTETMVLDLGLDPGQIAWDERPVNTWRSILLEVDRLGRIDDLVRMAGQRYPKDEQLAHFIAQYHEIDWRSELFLVGRRFVWAVPDALPPNYVPRPDLLAEVRTVLLADIDTLALTSTIKMNALHGMGGIGKSVMARALCDDPEVQATFPDGILWARVGQTPDLVPSLREWIYALGGIVSETAPTVDRLKSILTDLLRERSCLLIADDVWKKAHAEVFRVGGHKCRFMLTTRDAALAEEMGASVHAVPVMAEAEAINLLEEWADGSLCDTVADLKTKIVRRMGRLPLAIKLAGAQLQHQDPAQWLASFDARKLKTRRVEDIHDSLAATFALSLDDLDPADRRLYVALAIFREDEPIRVAGIDTLWSVLDQRRFHDTHSLLDDLASRALLQRSQMDSDGILIHDLFRDFMFAELGHEGRIAAHCALLDAYRARQQDQGWHTVPDDGYLYDHLAYHLDQLVGEDSETADELNELFANPSWLHTRVAQSNYRYDGFIADLDTTWRYAQTRADIQIETSVDPSALADCVRLALIRCTINSLAASYVPELVGYAVKNQIWPLERALSIAFRVPDAPDRAAIWLGLLQTGALPTSNIQEAAQHCLTAASQINSQSERAEILANLVPHLPDDLVEQALVLAIAFSEEALKSRSIEVLAPRLSQESLQQALIEASALNHEGFRAEVLARILPLLSRQQLNEGIAAVQASHNEANRHSAVRSIGNSRLHGTTDSTLGEKTHTIDKVNASPSGFEAQTQEIAQDTSQFHRLDTSRALSVALEIWDNTYRAEVLARLAYRLTGGLRDKALREALAAALAIPYNWYRANALAMLVPQLEGEDRQSALEEALSSALGIRERWLKGEALASLGPYLSKELLERSLQSLVGVRDDFFVAKALVALSPFLSSEDEERVLQHSVDAIMRIQGSRDQSIALAGLPPEMSRKMLGAAVTKGLVEAAITSSKSYQMPVVVAEHHELREHELVRRLEGVCRSGSGAYRAEQLEILAPYLPTESMLEQATQAAIEIRNERYRSVALTALAPQLRGKLLRKVLAAAVAIHHEQSRESVLTALAPQLTSELVQEGLAAVRMIGDDETRARVLIALAPQLTGGLAQEGLALAQMIGNHEARARVMTVLVPQLTSETQCTALEEGLAMVRVIGDDETRARVLIALAPRLTGELAQEGLATARMIDDDETRARVLIPLAPQLTGGLAQEGLAMARMIDDDETRADVLTALLPQLAGETQNAALLEALAAAAAIRYRRSRESALTALVLQLTGELVQEGLAMARVIDDDETRADILTALAPKLTGELAQEGLAAAAAIRSRLSRKKALTALAPQLTGELAQEGLTMARMIDDDETRARVLIALAPQLTGGLAQEGLAMARMIDDDETRADVLTALMPQLVGETRSAALLEALAAAAEIRDQWSRESALTALTPQLSGELAQEGLAMARMIGDDGDRARILTALAPQLTGELAQEGLAIGRMIEDELARARILTALAPQLTGETQSATLREGLTAATLIRDQWSRVKVLLALAPQLTTELAQEGLAMARLIDDDNTRADILTALAPQLTRETQSAALKEGLAAAAAIRSWWSREKALTTLAPQLSGELVQEGLAMARMIDDDETRADVLTALLPQLAGETRNAALLEALAAAAAIRDQWFRKRALTALTPQLTGELAQKGLAMARMIDDGETRAHALTALAPHVMGELVAEGFAIAVTVRDRWLRETGLIALLPQLTDENREVAFRAAIMAASTVSDHRTRAEALVSLLPHMTDSTACVRSIRHAIAEHLRDNLASLRREDLLKFLADTSLIEPPILSPDTLAAIANHTIEICTEWEWP